MHYLDNPHRPCYYETIIKETDTMNHVVDASATFHGEEMTILYSAALGIYEEGDEVTDIEVVDLSILGVNVRFDDLPEALQAAILEQADDLTFEIKT